MNANTNTNQPKWLALVGCKTLSHHSLIHSNLSLHQVFSSSAAEEILVRGAGEIGDLGWLRYVSHFGAGLPWILAGLSDTPVRISGCPFSSGRIIDNKTAALGIRMAWSSGWSRGSELP